VELPTISIRPKDAKSVLVFYEHSQRDVFRAGFCSTYFCHFRVGRIVSSAPWCDNNIQVATANNGTVSATQFSEAIEIINEFKNVRSHLYDITVESGVADTVSPTDELTFEVQHAVSEGLGAFFNGAYQYNGAIQYTYISDDTNFTVL